MRANVGESGGTLGNSGNSMYFLFITEYYKRDREEPGSLQQERFEKKAPVVSLLSEARLSIECAYSETMKVVPAATICCHEFLSIHEKRRKTVFSPKAGSMSKTKPHKQTGAVMTSRKSCELPEPQNNTHRSEQTSQDYNSPNLFALGSSLGLRREEGDPLRTSQNSNLHYKHRVSNMSQRHFWTTVSMVFTTVIVLSSFSSVTMVACVPLRHPGDQGSLDLTRSDIKTGMLRGQLSPTETSKFHLNPVQSMGHQHPYARMQSTDGILHSNPGYATNKRDSNQAARSGGESMNQKISSQDYPLDTMQSRTASQKSRKDVIRSVSANNYDGYGYDTAEDSDEIDNIIGSKLEIPEAATSSQMRLEKVELPQNSLMEESNTIPTGKITDFLPPTDGESDSDKWETVVEPRLYVLTELGIRSNQEPLLSVLRQQRKRRNSGNGPSLSIVNPLDVLRQRLLLEIARRRMRQSQNRIIANEEYLRKIGRR